MYDVKISDDYELSCVQMTNSKEDELNMNLIELIEKWKWSIIAHYDDHCDDIISRKTQLQHAPTWPRIVSFDSWKLVSYSKSLCPACNYTHENSFVQFMLCESWVHLCWIQKFYDKDALSSSNKNDHFWCKICTDKINF